MRLASKRPPGHESDSADSHSNGTESKRRSWSRRVEIMAPSTLRLASCCVHDKDRAIPSARGSTVWLKCWEMLDRRAAFDAQVLD